MSGAAAPAIEVKGSTPGFIGDLLLLTKSRLSLLVLVTTFVGFELASASPLDWTLLLHTMIGTGLVTASAAILNQLMETKTDVLMNRTRDRPLPSGRMQTATALVLGYLGAAVGFCWLFALVNLTAAYLAVLTLIIYLFLYTPMKRVSSFCVTLGAISGAIPPVIGWAAAKPSLGAGAWILFGVLFLWQFPHFLAIAWLYREDYEKAGLVMLMRRDRSGLVTAWNSLLGTVALTVVTLLPFALGMAGPIYLAGALALNAMFLWCAVGFLRERSRVTARPLFFASIIYLPCILALMVFTKA